MEMMINGERTQNMVSHSILKLLLLLLNAAYLSNKLEWNWGFKNEILDFENGNCRPLLVIVDYHSIALRC